MSAIFLILVIFINCLFIQCAFDPSKIDFCKAKCTNVPSTACYCKQSKDKHDILEQPIEEFRQTVLDEHNKLRNKIASGGELQRNKYPSAANMLALSYDLELEHLARCYILSNFTSGHDKCRMTSYCTKGGSGAGQNLFGISSKSFQLTTISKAINSWYSELTDIPIERRASVIKRYDKTVFSYGVGHFTQIIWGNTRRIGCVRAWLPNNTHPVYKTVVACNYAGPDESCAGNVLGRSIYAIGKPCSECGEDVKCNKDTEGGKYDALCGAIEPVPKDPLPNLESGSTKTQKVTHLSIMIIVMVAVVEGWHERYMQSK